ncbi:MAG: hypothetical protein KDE32_10715 [Novosphingobium sp.]|nr:hypothetical protein [Novosphingobium sp.]
MTIFGECEAHGRRLPVTITGLDRSGCALACDASDTLPQGVMALWIGAIGPLAAVAMQKDASHANASFDEPLDPRILDHFAEG